MEAVSLSRRYSHVHDLPLALIALAIDFGVPASARPMLKLSAVCRQETTREDKAGRDR